MFRLPLRLVTVGYAKPIKGWHILLESIKNLPKGSIHLRLVGSWEKPIYSRKLNKLINDVEELAQVEILGYLNSEEIAQQYQWADLLVLPSLEESFNITLRESICCGLPAIVSNVPVLQALYHNMNVV